MVAGARAGPAHSIPGHLTGRATSTPCVCTFSVCNGAKREFFWWSFFSAGKFQSAEIEALAEKPSWALEEEEEEKGNCPAQWSGQRERAKFNPLCRARQDRTSCLRDDSRLWGFPPFHDKFCFFTNTEEEKHQQSLQPLPSADVKRSWCCSAVPKPRRAGLIAIIKG